ncbi:MAG: hypothetical protein NVSMB55_08970 [Mycobacteriales bacterium]
MCGSNSSTPGDSTQNKDDTDVAGPVSDTSLAAVTAATAGQLLLTIAEAAAVLRVSRAKLYELMRRGEVASVRLGGSRRIPRTALVGYIEMLTETAVTDAAQRRQGTRPDWRSQWSASALDISA